MPPIILASGGLDSFLAWILYAKEGKNLFINIDHGYANKEFLALSRLQQKIPDFEFEQIKGAPIGKFELQPSGIIPMRNAELILMAAQFGNEIILGVTKDEINSDKSTEFFTAMENVLNISMMGQYWNDDQGTLYQVYSPLREKSKAALVADYLRTGFPVEWLLATTSCYSTKGRHCGACPSCFKRWVALILNDLSDDFASYPVIWAEETGIIRKARDGTYSKERSIEIMDAVEKEGC